MLSCDRAWDNAGARRDAARLAWREGVQVPGVMDVGACTPSCGNVWGGARCALVMARGPC